MSTCKHRWVVVSDAENCCSECGMTERHIDYGQRESTLLGEFMRKIAEGNGMKNYRIQVLECCRNCRYLVRMGDNTNGCSHGATAEISGEWWEYVDHRLVDDIGICDHWEQKETRK